MRANKLNHGEKNRPWGAAPAVAKPIFTYAVAATGAATLFSAAARRTNSQRSHS